MILRFVWVSVTISMSQAQACTSAPIYFPEQQCTIPCNNAMCSTRGPPSTTQFDSPYCSNCIQAADTSWQCFLCPSSAERSAALAQSNPSASIASLRLDSRPNVSFNLDMSAPAIVAIDVERAWAPQEYLILALSARQLPPAVNGSTGLRELVEPLSDRGVALSAGLREDGGAARTVVWYLQSDATPNVSPPLYEYSARGNSSMLVLNPYTRYSLPYTHSHTCVPVCLHACLRASVCVYARACAV